jgi:hypothetical protein
LIRNDRDSGSLSALIFLLIFIINVCVVSIKNDIETENCSENSQRIIPKIVHVSDSSVKILKWKNYEKTIKKTDPLFFVPESILRIDTCNGNVEVK